MSRTPGFHGSRGRGQRRALRLVAAGLGVVAGLGLVELALRLLVPEDAVFAGSGFYLADAELGVRLAPGYEGGNVHINALGMRDREHARDKPPGVRRLLLLGDSFAFGATPDPETHFAHRLEARLARHRGGAWEVLNAGVPTWGTVQQARYLEREGLALDPDVVLVTVYIGNDVTDGIDAPQFTALAGYLVPRDAARGVSRVRLRLAVAAQRLRLWRLLRERLLRQAAETDPFWREVLRLGPRLYELRLEMHRKRPDRPDELEAGWRATLQSLESLQRLSEAHGARFGVVLIPDDLQINPHWHRALEESGVRLDEFDFDAANRRLLRFCAERGIAALDLARALAPRYRRGRRPYGPEGTKLDGHLNELGDGVVAEQIESWLRRQRWLGTGRLAGLLKGQGTRAPAAAARGQRQVGGGEASGGKPQRAEKGERRERTRATRADSHTPAKARSPELARSSAPIFLAAQPPL